jgi:hypothetical protein
MVRLAQTVHLSCTKSNTISKRTERGFYMTHVTQEFHRVHPKWSMGLWYVWCKLWIYLARLTLSPNAPKQDSTWPTSPRSIIQCVQNNFLCLWYVWRKLCTYLALKLTLSPNGPKRASIWASSPRSIIQCIQNNFWDYGMFGANRAPIMHRN